MSSQTIVDELVKAGIDAEPYRRGPEGAFPFVASISPKRDGVIRIWQGHSDVKAYTDSSHRQAVLNIKEVSTKITRNVKVRVTWYPASHSYANRGSRSGSGEGIYHVSTRGMFYDPKQLHDAIRRRAMALFPVWVPNPKWKAAITEDGLTKLKKLNGLKTIQERSISVAVTATSQPTAGGQHLLMGFDEKYHFIAALRRGARSVESAHKQLRPKEVTPDALRQGEWFFVPVDEDLATTLDTYSTTVSRRRNRLPVFSGQLERDSSHRGTQLVRYDKALYAYGFITDARVGHHEKLFLPEWHKVVRNTEVVTAPVRRQQQTRRWD